MTRRELAKTALASAFLSPSRADLEERPAGSQADARGAGTTKPNIVLMLTDNVGYGELGVYGGGILRGALLHASTNLRRRACGY